MSFPVTAVIEYLRCLVVVLIFYVIKKCFFLKFNLYWPMNVRLISTCLFYILQAIRVFLLLRDLCLLIRNEEETQLPLNKVENPVNEEDVLDLSKL